MRRDFEDNNSMINDIPPPPISEKNSSAPLEVLNHMEKASAADQYDNLVATISSFADGHVCPLEAAGQQ